MIPLEFLQSIAPDRGLKPAELEVLSLSLSGASTEEIATRLSISEDLVRKRLSRIYQKFHIEGRGPVKLAKLQQLLHSLYQNHPGIDRRVTPPMVGTHPGNTLELQPFVSPAQSSIPNRQSPVLNYIDWDEAIDVSTFYGRIEELTELERWILQENCRLISVLGIGGIGKTALLAKLAQQINPYFDCIIERSLRNASALSELLDDLLTSLSRPHEPDLPEKAEEKITQLITLLRDRRCLIVLDDVQEILRSEDQLGRYLRGYEGYGLLFRQVAEAQHQSCLLVSSREKLREISLLATPSRPVRTLKLEGLKPEEAQRILQEKGLVGQQYWGELIEYYGRNPLRLKLIASTIQDIFNSDVSNFVKLGTIVVSDREVLDDQFKRLSRWEKGVMSYLAKEARALSFQQLFQRLQSRVETIAASDLIEALESLGGRSLIEKVKSPETSELLFTLQPVIKKYVSKWQLSSEEKIAFSQ